MDEKERRTLLTDNWNGFANLLANLVEKYAAVLDIDNLPEPLSCLEEENTSEEPFWNIESYSAVRYNREKVDGELFK